MQLDDEEIRDFQQRTFFEKKESNEVNPVSIFFAVLAAILVSWFIRAAYIDWQLRQVADEFNQQISIMSEQTQQQVRSMQLKNEAMKAESEEKARLNAEKVMQQKIAAHQVELDKRAAVANEIDARTRKEAAWIEFYKPTRGCEKDNPDRDAIKCGNDYIKAHNRFEQSWVSNSN